MPPLKLYYFLTARIQCFPPVQLKIFLVKILKNNSRNTIHNLNVKLIFKLKEFIISTHKLSVNFAPIFFSCYPFSVFTSLINFYAIAKQSFFYPRRTNSGNKRIMVKYIGFLFIFGNKNSLAECHGKDVYSYNLDYFLLNRIIFKR